MERLESEHLDADVMLQAEHRHRYMWAAGYTSGDVCDLACGYGYGAEVLAANSVVKSYVGIDASAIAVSQANQRFASDLRRYVLASATAIPLGDQSVDTVVSLETLEHLVEPANAVEEFKRILRPNGVLVGSVPSKYFDDKAQEVYGLNPYHVSRFTYASLTDLLNRYFQTVRVYYSALEVVTHIGSLVEGHPVQAEMAASIHTRPNDEVNGSFHFVATNRHWPDIDTAHQSKVYFCMGLTDLDASRVIPLRKLIDQNERLVRLKDENIRQAEEIIRQRDQDIRQAEEIIRQLNKKILPFPGFFRGIRKCLRIISKNSQID